MELNDEGQIKEPVTRVVVTKNSIKGNCNGEDHPKEASNALLKWDILRK